MNNALFSHLNVDKVPPLVGEEAQHRLADCLRLLSNTMWPLYLSGPSGSGKTIMAMNIARHYSMDNNVPCYYVQLSPEMTKTSLILGLRLTNGSLHVVDGVVADCMRTGGIIVIDEATHTTSELLLMLNSILDRTSVTSVGDRIIYAAETFRVVFCSNDSSYAGNIRLPQSFAQRMVAFQFDYPSFESELLITQRIAEDECKIPIAVPDSAVRYIVATIRMIRTPQYPLSARNAAVILVLLNLAATVGSGMDPYFTDSDTAEAKRRSAATRILQIEADVLSMDDLLNPAVTEFHEFVSRIGVNAFRQAFLSGMMYYLDVEGLELNQDTMRNSISNQII